MPSRTTTPPLAPFTHRPSAFLDDLPLCLPLYFFPGTKEELVFASPPGRQTEPAVRGIEALAAEPYGDPGKVDHARSGTPQSSVRVSSRPRIERPGVGRRGSRYRVVDTTLGEDQSPQPRTRWNVSDVPPQQGIAETGPESSSGSRARGFRTLKLECGRRVLWLGIRRGRWILGFAFVRLRHDFRGRWCGRSEWSGQLRDEDSRDPDAGAGVGRPKGSRQTLVRFVGRVDATGQDERMDRDGHDHAGQESPVALPTAGFNARGS